MIKAPWPNEDPRYPPEHPLSRESNEAARRSGQQIRKVPNYQQQAVNSEQMMRKCYEQMRAEGWQYNERQRYWWHPEQPGVTISQ